jgi:hypothetical protein
MRKSPSNARDTLRPGRSPLRLRSLVLPQPASASPWRLACGSPSAGTLRALRRPSDSSGLPSGGCPPVGVPPPARSRAPVVALVLAEWSVPFGAPSGPLSPLTHLTPRFLRGLWDQKSCKPSEKFRKTLGPLQIIGGPSVVHAGPSLGPESLQEPNGAWEKRWAQFGPTAFNMTGCDLFEKNPNSPPRTLL